MKFHASLALALVVGASAHPHHGGRSGRGDNYGHGDNGRPVIGGGDTGRPLLGADGHGLPPVVRPTATSNIGGGDTGRPLLGANGHGLPPVVTPTATSNIGGGDTGRPLFGANGHGLPPVVRPTATSNIGGGDTGRPLLGANGHGLAPVPSEGPGGSCMAYGEAQFLCMGKTQAQCAASPGICHWVTKIATNIGGGDTGRPLIGGGDHDYHPHSGDAFGGDHDYQPHSGDAFASPAPAEYTGNEEDRSDGFNYGNHHGWGHKRHHRHHHRHRGHGEDSPDSSEDGEGSVPTHAARGSGGAFAQPPQPPENEPEASGRDGFAPVRPTAPVADPAFANVIVDRWDEVPANNPEPTQTAIGMGNPASVNCIKFGGKLEIRSARGVGEAGYCVMPDKSECEEWAFARGTCAFTTCVAKTTMQRAQCAGKMGCFVAQCDLTTNTFARMQCHEGRCWCVDVQSGKKEECPPLPVMPGIVLPPLSALPLMPGIVLPPPTTEEAMPTERPPFHTMPGIVLPPLTAEAAMPTERAPTEAPSERVPQIATETSEMAPSPEPTTPITPAEATTPTTPSVVTVLTPKLPVEDPEQWAKDNNVVAAAASSDLNQARGVSALSADRSSSSTTTVALVGAALAVVALGAAAYLYRNKRRQGIKLEQEEVLKEAFNASSRQSLATSIDVASGTPSHLKETGDTADTLQVEVTV